MTPQESNITSVKFLSCNGMGFSPKDIISGLTRTSFQLPDGFGFTDRDAIFTYQGRYAVHLICELLNIRTGDEVLTPAYNCGAEIDPFVWAGAKVIFYRIDEQAAIDEQDILRRVTPSTKVIYVSHFFGWPQKIEELSHWCRENKIFLVEDCALSLFSKGPDNAIGQTGDAAIYSFVKSLPVPDGGALILKNKELRKITIPIKPPPFRNILLNSLPLLKKWMMNTNKLWQRHELSRKLINRSWMKRSTDQDCAIEREMPKSNYFDAQKVEWSISKLSRSIISKTNPLEVIETRRRNYQYLQNALRNVSSIRLLFDDLPDNVCPLSLPIYVNDRNLWADALENLGVLVGGWPSYHRGFDWKDFPEARHLKNDLITLPVHQDLELYHMEYIAECVQSIAEGHGHYYS